MSNEPLVLEQVALALSRPSNHTPGAEAAGAALVRTGGCVLALDAGDREDVLRGIRDERGRVLDRDPAASLPVVGCMVTADCSIAPLANPIGGYTQPILVTPRAALAAADEAQRRLADAWGQVTELRGQVDEMRLESIDSAQDLADIGRALDATGVPREDSDGAPLGAAARARVAGICASHGWRITDVRIRQPTGRVTVEPRQPPTSSDR